jgi:hypothetical protein
VIGDAVDGLALGNGGGNLFLRGFGVAHLFVESPRPSCPSHR